MAPVYASQNEPLTEELADDGGGLGVDGVGG
jgi:hypothetical protein